MKIKIEWEDLGCSVYVNGELEHEHNYRSSEAVEKWIALLKKYTDIEIEEENLE